MEVICDRSHGAASEPGSIVIARVGLFFLIYYVDMMVNVAVLGLKM